MTGWEEKRRPAPTPVFARCSALSGVEFGSALGLILGFEWPGWRRRWPRLWSEILRGATDRADLLSSMPRDRGVQPSLMYC